MAAPSAFQMATYALDGASYATTGKSATDHVISAVADKDCAMTRALKGDDICVEKPDTVTLMPDGTRPLNADDDAFAIKPANQDQTFQAFSAANDQSSTEDSDEVFAAIQPVQPVQPVEVARSPSALQVDGVSNLPAVPVVPVQVKPLPTLSTQDVAPAPSAVPEPVVPQPVTPPYATGLFDDDEVLSDEDIARLDLEMQAASGLALEGH